MSKSLIVNFSNQGVNDNTTAYFGLTGAFSSALTEANAEMPVRDAGNFSNMFSYVTTNTLLVDTVVTLRKSAADTALTVTYTSTQTGVKEDTSNTVAFANTDKIVYKIATANDLSGVKTITFTSLGLQFDPTTTTDCISFLGTTRNVNVLNYSNDSTSSYWTPIQAITQMTNTESRSLYKIKDNFISTNLYTYVSSNARTTDTVFRTRVNGANGNQSVTYTSTQTGIKEDTSNTDSLAINDTFNYAVVTLTGGGIIAFQVMSTRLVNTDGKFIFGIGKVNVPESINFNSTIFFGLSGDLEASSTTEADAQVTSRFDFTAKELVSHVISNTITTSSSTIVLRVNGADTALSVTYSASQTGLKNNTVDTVSVVSTDEVNYKVTTPNTSGALGLGWVGMIGKTTTASINIKSPGGGVAYSGGSFMF